MQGIEWSLYDSKVFVTRHISLGTLTAVREYFYNTVVYRYIWSRSTQIPRQWEPTSDIYAWLVLGMTIGDRSLIERTRYDQFISSGLVHLIAVSGGNIAIIVIFLWVVLWWVPFYVRQIILILAVLGYASIVGDDSSVIRATVMGLLTLIALLPGRQISIWRSMSYARCGMLLRDPYYLMYDVGFILSFCAVVGIIRADKTRTLSSLKTILSDSHHRWSTWLSSLLSWYVIPTLWATIGVTPLLLVVMEKTNLTSVLVNIVIAPFVPLITVAGFVAPYLPVSWWWDIFLRYMLDYILYQSARATQYGLYLSLGEMTQVILVIFVWCAWVYRIARQE